MFFPERSFFDHPGSFVQSLYKIISDILVHEAIHQPLCETGQEDDRERSYKGHGRKFCYHTNRIGQIRDLPEVFLNEQPLCMCWPFNVESIEYYLNPVDGMTNVERSIIVKLVELLAMYGPDGGGGLAMRADGDISPLSKIA